MGVLDTRDASQRGLRPAPAAASLDDYCRALLQFFAAQLPATMRVMLCARALKTAVANGASGARARDAVLVL